MKERLREERRQREAAEAARKDKEEDQSKHSQASPSSQASGAPFERRDSSPVKPLSSILNIDKLLSTSPAPEQVAALWNAYHGSRSGGTGRGFLSAALPVATYENMVNVARRYPRFVVPLPRQNIEAEWESKQAYEFYYMEWAFHGAPQLPKSSTDILSTPKQSSNPHTSTILFTPLQEYKLRQSFATPYFVMTHYPDLVHSHGIVLLRGEITPSSAAQGDGRYMLSQEDAHRLAVSVQAFYLWNDKDTQDTMALLQKFHENPEEFNWEDLLKTMKV
ncbi:ATP11-domain-containing protein [Obba rivulosa]|uniref:ATP11-domain-containing protein n=1 Tax=Obba rivulosa TaxID=1052685 RepID=A0A8E2DR53_9APHY|nr:ATP11-domain-containing protein [Obba rivulosa]